MRFPPSVAYVTVVYRCSSSYRGSGCKPRGLENITKHRISPNVVRQFHCVRDTHGKIGWKNIPTLQFHCVREMHASEKSAGCRNFRIILVIHIINLIPLHWWGTLPHCYSGRLFYYQSVFALSLTGNRQFQHTKGQAVTRRSCLLVSTPARGRCYIAMRGVGCLL